MLVVDVRRHGDVAVDGGVEVRDADRARDARGQRLDAVDEGLAVEEGAVLVHVRDARVEKAVPDGRVA